MRKLLSSHCTVKQIIVGWEMRRDRRAEIVNRIIKSESGKRTEATWGYNPRGYFLFVF